jgi:hypothetical protein
MRYSLKILVVAFMDPMVAFKNASLEQVHLYIYPEPSNAGQVMVDGRNVEVKRAVPRGGDLGMGEDEGGMRQVRWMARFFLTFFCFEGLWAHCKGVSEQWSDV